MAEDGGLEEAVQLARAERAERAAEAQAPADEERQQLETDAREARQAAARVRDASHSFVARITAAGIEPQQVLITTAAKNWRGKPRQFHVLAWRICERIPGDSGPDPDGLNYHGQPALFLMKDGTLFSFDYWSDGVPPPELPHNWDADAIVAALAGEIVRLGL